jgi:quinol monooxygenase YgiN
MMTGPRCWTEGVDAVNDTDPAVIGSQERSMSTYGCYVKFTARPGQRDVLVDHLLGVAAHAETTTGCQLYLINTSPTESESVWVTEVWTSQHEHDASLSSEDARAAIQQVLPLLAGSPEKIDLVPVGGKGLPLP